MIGRRFQRKSDEAEVETPKGFDDFELRLGDIMRGERATMGKSLLDVQRELRIKANYIAAIENCDPSAFDTPGFIAGYVRSYARYLGMDAEDCFSKFCAESGFEVAHGMSAQASGVKKQSTNATQRRVSQRDPFITPNTPFAPARDPVLSRIEPRAVGSIMVLVALIGGIGYGGWSVLKQVQQVQVAPVEQAPLVLADLDPLNGAGRDTEAADGPTVEALDRLYRPQALEVPVLVSRDAPIASLDPRSVGMFQTPQLPEVQLTETQRAVDALLPQVVEELEPTLKIVAVSPAWMRVTSADGSVIFEGTLGTVEQGNTYEVPLTEEPPTLRVGESGAVYFTMNGAHYGPVGARGTVTKNVELSMDAVGERFAVADLEADQNQALRQLLVAEAQDAATRAPAN
ncbi:helix-turn-helix domain-containing protein [Ruegeria marina]|nr:helix-turn-helix domain-containing protein [Ruegeria marina]